MTTRYAKILLSLALAAFAVMVTFNNISDYGSNFAFVSHVLSMDTTFAGNTAMYRAITTPSLWHAAYWLIILGEGLTGALLAYLWRAIAVARAQGRRQQLRPGEERRHRRGNPGSAGVVLRLHGGRRRMVPDVAIEDLERSRGRLPVLHGPARRADLRQSG